MLKEAEKNSMDLDEKRLEELFEKQGYARSIARCIIYFLSQKEGTSKQIERAMDLRQPEVSTSMKALIKEGMIIKIHIRMEKKGRPELLYKLSIGNKQLFNKIEKMITKKIEKTLKNLQELRKTIDSM